MRQGTNPLERSKSAPSEFMLRVRLFAGWAVAGGIALVSGLVLSSNQHALLAIFLGWIPAAAVLLALGWLAMQAYARQARDHRYLGTLARATRILCQEDFDQVLHTTAEQMMQTTGADSCIIFLTDAQGDTLVPQVVKLHQELYDAQMEALWRELRVVRGQGMAGWTFANKEPILSGDTERDPRSYYLPGSVPEMASAVIVPLVLGDRVLGVIRASRKGLNQFSPEDLHLATVLAGQAAVAVEQTRLRRELEDLLVTDALTGVYNRHYLQRVLQPALKQQGVSQMAALMIDLYDFKSYNDTYGHLAGDQRLRATGQLLRETARSSDIVVRYGGDEFVVVMPGATENEAAVLASRISAAVERYNQQSGELVSLGLNVGIRSAAVETLEQLLSQADAAMYVDKRRADRRRINHLLTLLETRTQSLPRVTPAADHGPTLAETKATVRNSERLDPQVIAALLDVLALEEARAEAEGEG